MLRDHVASVLRLGAAWNDEHGNLQACSQGQRGPGSALGLATEPSALRHDIPGTAHIREANHGAALAAGANFLNHLHTALRQRARHGSVVAASAAAGRAQALLFETLPAAAFVAIGAGVVNANLGAPAPGEAADHGIEASGASNHDAAVVLSDNLDHGLDDGNEELGREIAWASEADQRTWRQRPIYASLIHAFLLGRMLQGYGYAPAKSKNAAPGRTAFSCASRGGAR